MITSMVRQYVVFYSLFQKKKGFPLYCVSITTKYFVCLSTYSFHCLVLFVLSLESCVYFIIIPGYNISTFNGLPFFFLLTIPYNEHFS